MKLLSLKAAAVIAGLCHTSNALNVTILADTNRDGRVDVSKCSTDSRGKDTWTEDRGALFLANIGDTDQRCSRDITNETPDEDLDKCHDASDDVQRNPKYLAPLRTLPLEVSHSAEGSIHVTGNLAADNVRIFFKAGADWDFVGANYTFTAEDLKTGLELGIDARDIRRPGGWDGRAEVHFTVQDGQDKATDSVVLRVAPLLTHHHAQQAERVFATRANWNNSQPAFVSDLSRHVAEAGIAEPVFLFPQDDIWTQDFFEPGYMSIPGPEGKPVALRVMIRSVQTYRPSGRQVFQLLRNEDVGAVQHLDWGSTTDSTGNLETIPPYEHEGKAYPAGRIIMGSQQGVLPLIFPFLQAQETQDPLELDTSWLAVGHVDEFLQFLPFDNERGWILMADDPLAGLDILEKASAAGAVEAFSRPRHPSDPPFGDPSGVSIDQVFDQFNFQGLNKYCADRIEANLDILKRETGLAEEDIIRVPALFYYAYWGGNSTSLRAARDVKARSSGPAKPLAIVEAARPPSSGKSEGPKRRQWSPLDQALAHHPGTINGLVLSDTQVLSPNPWGPVVEGRDLLADGVTAAYARAGFNVTFMDDWFSHHVGGGEVHCGSNSWRSTEAPWWE